MWESLDNEAVLSAFQPFSLQKKHDEYFLLFCASTQKFLHSATLFLKATSAQAKPSQFQQF